MLKIKNYLFAGITICTLLFTTNLFAKNWTMILSAPDGYKMSITKPTSKDMYGVEEIKDITGQDTDHIELTLSASKNTGEKDAEWFKNYFNKDIKWNHHTIFYSRKDCSLTAAFFTFCTTLTITDKQNNKNSYNIWFACKRSGSYKIWMLGSNNFNFISHSFPNHTTTSDSKYSFFATNAHNHFVITNNFS